MNIYGNEKTDKKVKLGSRLRTVHHEVITLLNFLKRKSNYESAECFYYRNTIQNPTHLILKCSEYRADSVKVFEGLDNNQKSIEYLFNTKINREKLFKFLKKN